MTWNLVWLQSRGKKKEKKETDKGEQTWFPVPVWQEHASSHFACMWVTHTVPSCSAESAAPPLRPPTSAPQKQSPAFSSQMEVTPYASKPLSLCHGSSANTSRGNKEREEDAARSAHQRRAGVHLLKVLGNNAVCWILMRPDEGLAARSAPRSGHVYLCLRHWLLSNSVFNSLLFLHTLACAIPYYCIVRCANQS